jgi:hypothetical protein
VSDILSPGLEVIPSIEVCSTQTILVPDGITFIESTEVRWDSIGEESAPLARVEIAPRSKNVINNSFSLSFDVLLNIVSFL